MQLRLSEFQRNQLSVVASVTPFAMAGHMLNTTILTITLAGSVPGTQLIGWAAYSFGIALVLIYRHLGRRNRVPNFGARRETHMRYAATLSHAERVV